MLTPRSDCSTYNGIVTLPAVQINNEDGTQFSYSGEALLCIAVITHALLDLDRLDPTSPDWRSARRFFFDPTSNWAWMQTALRSVNPSRIEAHANHCIHAKTAGSSRTQQPC